MSMVPIQLLFFTILVVSILMTCAAHHNLCDFTNLKIFFFKLEFTILLLFLQLIVTYYNFANTPKNELLNYRRQYQMKDFDILGICILGTVAVDMFVCCFFSYYRYVCTYAATICELISKHANMHLLHTGT